MNSEALDGEKESASDSADNEDTEAEALDPEDLENEDTEAEAIASEGPENEDTEDTEAEASDQEDSGKQNDVKEEEAEKEKNEVEEKEEGETEEEEAEEEPAVPPDIELVMVGDILLHIPVVNTAKREDGTYDFSAIFSRTKDEISKADVALVNEEVMIGGSELGITGYPTFNAPFEIADALHDTGFDVILHATNHALDRGKQGIINCTTYWEENYPDIVYTGIAAREEDSKDICIYESGGYRLAILNYTYGTNGIPFPEDMPYAVNMLEEERVISDIKRAEKEADLTIICPHWGWEYNLDKNPEQEKWAQLFLENGADLVIGTHPHVIEPIEELRRENGEIMPIFYSIGNFVSWTSGTGNHITDRLLGGMAKVKIGYDEEGRVSVKDYKAKALICDLHRDMDGVVVYPLSEYNEEMAMKNEILRQDSKFSYEYLVNMCDEIWGERWE
ncbi:MAG: CapA family protein [Lachnospiraceae bacterium]|nr:CapA family protein [Lachnospiraceae bacterium]